MTHFTRFIFDIAHKILGNLQVLSLILLLTVANHAAWAAPSVIQPNIQSWVKSARTARAGVWLIGDSIASGFDAGFSDTLSKNFGLAGTGLSNDFTGGNNSYTITPPYPLNSNNWNTAITAVRSDRQSYVPAFGEPITAGNSPAQYYTAFINPSSYLDPQAAYDWNLYTASADGGGTMQARQFVDDGTGAYPTLHLDAPIITRTPASGLQHTIFHFDKTTGHAGQVTATQLLATTNTSVLYSRLLKSNSTGATLTTWADGGHTTLDMIRDKIEYMSPLGVAQYMTAVTDSDSGQLMVVIEEGNNDHGQITTSIRGVAPSNTSAGFNDNLTFMMDELRSDWTLAGKSPSDLSFLLLGMYEKNPIADPTGNAFIRGSAQVMHDVSVASSDASFIDLHEIAPSWQDAYNSGFMADDIHPTTLGAITFANAVFSQLVPEPTGVAVVILIAGFIFQRPRCQRAFVRNSR